MGSLMGKFPEHSQTSNVLISNVPGSRKKLFVMGAELEASYAFNVLSPGTSLMVVGFTYCDSLDIAIVAHKSAIPDLRKFSEAIETTFSELKQGSL